MENLRRALLRLLTAFRHGRAEGELGREVEAHLGELQREFERRGLSPGEARVAARRAFGGVEQLKEQQRDARSFRWLEDLRRDVGYGVRTLSRTRGFTITAMLTLALGISAVTVIYSVLRNVVLDPFPYSRSDRLVNVVLRDSSDRQVRGPYFPAEEFLFYQQQATAFEDVVGTSRDSMLWQGDNGPERLDVVWMTPNGFDFLGVKPMLGRVFDASDAAPDAPRVAVMCHRIWLRSFAGDAGVLGRTLVLDGTAWTIIGVMPPRFEWNIADLWVPAEMNPADDPQTPRGTRAFQAHLRPGVSAKEAETQLNVIGARRARDYPNQYPPQYRFQVIKVIDWVVRDFRAVLYTLFGAVSLLLVIACCNVANMLLARATIRERELAIRAAIGASRARIVRQGITEGLVLAAIGGAAGIALGTIGVRAGLALVPADIARLDQVRLDRTVLAFTVSIVIVTGVLFGLASTQVGGRWRPGGPVSLTIRGTAATASGRHLRQWMIGFEAGLAMLLLVVAVLLASAFRELARTDLGFEPRGLVAVSFRRLPPAFRNAERARATERALLGKLTAIPGVKAAAATSVAPLGERGANIPMTVVGRPDLTEGAVEWRAVSPGYADVIGLRLRAGRWLTDEDAATNRPVTVVNASLAARYWPNANPLGQHIWLGVFRGEVRPGSNPTALEIVGVVDDVRELGPTRPTRRTALIPRTDTTGLPVFLVRAEGAADDALRAAVRETDAALPEPVVSTLESRLASRLSKDRFASLLAQLFAAMALLMTATGVYGVVSWAVRHATREIGIRMALGATHGRVLRDVLLRGLSPVFAGLLLGAAAAIAASNLFVGLVAGAARVSVGVMAFAAALLMVAAAISVWIPARRAMTIDPAAALRMD